MVFKRTIGFMLNCRFAYVNVAFRALASHRCRGRPF
uniref:Uncharacterized protein n=1 Tax=Anguilla anguilla TaxID=7936 RepID=A0A0E9T6X8_ANGAN